MTTKETENPKEKAKTKEESCCRLRRGIDGFALIHGADDEVGEARYRLEPHTDQDIKSSTKRSNYPVATPGAEETGRCVEPSTVGEPWDRVGR
jgi:hypothetical protein